MKQNTRKKSTVAKAANGIHSPSPKVHPKASAGSMEGTPAKPIWTPSATAASESTLRHLVYAAAPQFAEQSSGGPPPPPPPPPTACKVLAFNTPFDRSGKVITPHATTFDVRESFKMAARFSNASGYECTHCSYHQEIKGYFNYQFPGDIWRTYPKILAGGKVISPTIYQEDGDPNGFPYGHRDGFNSPVDTYSPNPRISGCLYRGSDNPGLTGLPLKSNYDIMLDFKATIIDDTNPGGPPVATATWTVHLHFP